MERSLDQCKLLAVWTIEVAMFSTKSIIFLVSTILVICESGFVENLPKCKINDGDCERTIIKSVLQDIAKTGVPELGIPALDPMELRNMTFPILNVLDLTLKEGTLKGIKNCKVDKFSTDVESEHAFMELSCDSVTVKGQYKAFSSHSLIKAFLGSDTVSGEGNFKLKIERLRIRFDYFFYIQQRDNDIYINSKRDKTVYNHDIGKVTFFVDGLRVGNQDASELVSSLLNENWKMIMTTFGKSFMDRAMEIVYIFVHKFFDSVPCKYYILDDLTKYVKP